jgi:expansin (peptidoglycan-binding protein)
LPDQLAGNTRHLAGNTPHLTSNPSNTKHHSTLTNTCSYWAAAAGTCPAVHNSAATAPEQPRSSSSSSSSSDSELSWPLAWQLVCGHLTSSNATISGRAGLTFLPAVFKPLVKAAEACAMNPASSSNGGGVLGAMGSILLQLQCVMSWAVLLVATRVLRFALYIAQVRV